jgi:HSP20 family protein
MEDLFDRFVRDMFPSTWPSRELGSDIDWIPSTELIDKKTYYLFRADVPGVKKEDIAIAVEGDLLSIRGEMIRETKEESDDYYCCERSYGTFGRTLRLPSEVQSSKIEASLKDGVIEIKLPKVKTSKSTRKEIQVK